MRKLQAKTYENRGETYKNGETGETEKNRNNRAKKGRHRKTYEIRRKLRET